MEKLDRSLIALRTSPDEVFLSWRYLGTDPEDITFNIYRGETRINIYPVDSSTNYLDQTEEDETYSIIPVVDGVECRRSKSVNILNSNCIEIPLKDGNYYVQHAWPGDLDGNGQYDIVVSRLPKTSGTPVVEAYTLNGDFLWRIDMGPNASTQMGGVGLNDAPPAAISGWGNIAGYRDNDNITVFDLNSDGKAEVFIRTADEVVFGDGKVMNTQNLSDQYISVIDGTTGKELTNIKIPNDYISHGPMSGHFGIAYLNGKNPSLITKLENRREDKVFNLLIAAFDYDGKTITQKWLRKRESTPFANNFHQIRIIDVNQDGKDDICDGSYVVLNDGTFFYGVEGSVHGDRFHITDMDPDRPGLEGFSIQQAENGNYNQFPWYYYDATTGVIIRNGIEPHDVARGTVADIDPRYKGYEMWSDEGIFTIKGSRTSYNMPAVNFRIWWDEDLLSEILNNTSISKWNYYTQTENVIFSGSDVINTWRNAPPFYGDIIGDWREEVLWEKDDNTALRIYTTTDITNHRIYTLPHNAAYRNCLSVKGYYQSNLVDYYLGDSMAMPKQPDITYPDNTIPVNNLKYPWQNSDIGVVNFTGSAALYNDTFVIHGTGTGLASVEDAFHFIYQGIYGDAEITAKINSLENNPAEALAGIMFRESLAPGSKCIFLGLSDSAGLIYQLRKETDRQSAMASIPGYSLPYYMKIIRTNSTFTLYTSQNGINWTKLTATNISMEMNCYAGLVITGNNEEVFIYQGTFTEVAVDGISTGKILREIWNDIEGSSINDLKLSIKYPENPDTIDYLNNFESPGADMGDNFGTRLRGFLHPPVSGYYRFKISGDDNIELILSTDSSSTNGVKIATVPENTEPFEWNKYTQQSSDSIFLKAGNQYYIEMLHKESTGFDHYALLWITPGKDTAIVTGKYLSPYKLINITNIKKQQEKVSYNIFPNPVFDVLNIHSENPGDLPLEYILFSYMGIPLVSGVLRANTKSINLNYLPAGLYILELKDGENITSRKICKK